MSTPDAVSRAYLLAGLCLGERIDGFVDSYHGPQELRAQAADCAPVDALDRLDAALNGLPPSHRRTYFEAQMRAMRMAERVISGHDVDYSDQVVQSFDIEPEWVDEAEFRSAHYTMDQLLPGSGALAQRRQRYRAGFEIDNHQVLPLADAILADLRARTRALVPLPQTEQVELHLVSGQPWSGYNWYLGNMASRIEINTDLPVRLNDLPDLLAHEAYPGHHTEHAVREQEQMLAQGFGEFAIALLTTPQAVVSEGIATNAFDVVVPPAEQVAWLQEQVYGPAGMTVDIEGDLALNHAGRVLASVSGNAALLLHERGGSVEDAVAYVMQYGLRSEQEAGRTVEFLAHPLFRTYIYTYSGGYDLVSDYLQSRGDAPTAFHALLTEHWTPSRLRGSDRRRSSDDERLPL